MIRRRNFCDLSVGILPLLVYLLTLAPTITWRNNGADGGDLVSAAFTLGIPHPTGYPLYTLLAAIFSRLPFGEPARNVGAFSALASAGAILFLARAGRALTLAPPSHLHRTALGAVQVRAGVDDVAPLARWIPPSVALAFAFAPAVWSQATIPEVNALALFFTAALFAVVLSGLPYRLELAALIFGFALAHHFTILLLLPSAMILLTPARYQPTQYGRAALCALVPLALYLYLPLRAATHPPINWGNPETLDGFLWTISGAPYRQYLFAISPTEILARVGLAARFLFDQFTVVGVALGLWGAVRMAFDTRVRRVFIALILALALCLIYAIGYNSRDSFVYFAPAFMIFALWIMAGLSQLANHFANRDRLQTVVGTMVLVLFPLCNLALNFDTMNVSSDFTARDYARNILSQIPADAMIIADGDEHYFALQYYRHVVTPEKSQIIVSAELLQYPWYFDNIRRALPNVNASAANQLDRMVEVMDASLAQGRGGYTTLQNDGFRAYALERRDNFYRVLGRMR